MLFKPLVVRGAQDATLLYRLCRKRRMCVCLRVYAREVMLDLRDFL